MFSNRADQSTYDSFFRVLCVESDPLMQQLLTLGFGKYGLEVITAEHGIAAMMQFQAESGDFGAILINYDTPKLNGVDFAKWVRTLGFKGRIIIASACLSVSDLRAYQDCEISGILSRPFELSMVATLLLQAG